MHDLYLKILKRLAKSGIGQETDISDLFKRYFKEPPKKEIEKTEEGDTEPSGLEQFIEKTSHPRADKICEVLRVMEKNDWLTYTNHSVISNNYNWVKRPINITATITKEGDKYYRENKKNWWKTWSLWIAVGVGLLTAFGIWLSHKDATREVKPDAKKSQSSNKSQR